MEGGGKRVFWGSPVVDRDGDDVGGGDEGVEVVVVLSGEGSFDNEASSVEVNEEGKFLVWRDGFGSEDSGGDGRALGDDDVVRSDGGVGVV